MSAVEGSPTPHWRYLAVHAHLNAANGRDILLRIVAAALLAAAPACGHQAPPVQSPAEVTGSSSRAAQEFDPATVGRLDSAINDAMRSASIPGAIIGVWGPQSRTVRAVRVADKATGAAMNPYFYSRIGSETKTFTVTAVLQLVDQGNVSLDDPIAKYLVGVPQCNRITLRQLAKMQSGLYNYSDSSAFQQAYTVDPHRHFSPGISSDTRSRNPSSPAGERPRSRTSDHKQAGLPTPRVFRHRAGSLKDPDLTTRGILPL